MRNRYALIGKMIVCLAAYAILEILVVSFEELTGYRVGTLFREFIGW